MSMIDVNIYMENIIQEYLKYGSKSSFSVDDFLKIRQQAVDESLNGVRCGTSIIEQSPLSNNVSKSVSTNKIQKEDTIPTKINNSQTVKPVSTPVQQLNHDDIKSEKVEEEDLKENDKKFTEEDFLRIMREIDD